MIKDNMFTIVAMVIVLIFFSTLYSHSLRMKKRVNELESLLESQKMSFQLMEMESKKRDDELKKATEQANQKYKSEVKTGYSILKMDVAKGCDKAMLWGLNQAKML